MAKVSLYIKKRDIAHVRQMGIEPILLNAGGHYQAVIRLSRIQHRYYAKLRLLFVQLNGHWQGIKLTA